MYQIDIMSKVPVYEQIILQTERFILMGIMKPGDKMMSVRNLSIELSVNPNTIQKAIAELDRRGIINSVPGKGSFISENAAEILFNKGMDALEKLRDEVKNLRLSGVLKERIIKLVDEVYKDD